jgi:hypothetical protein
VQTENVKPKTVKRKKTTNVSPFKKGWLQDGSANEWTWMPDDRGARGAVWTAKGGSWHGCRWDGPTGRLEELPEKFANIEAAMRAVVEFGQEKPGTP